MNKFLLRLAGVATAAISAFAMQPAVISHATSPWNAGTIFVADQGHHSTSNGGLYAVDPSGAETPLAFGPNVGVTDVATDAAGNVYYTDCAGGGAFEIRPGASTLPLGAFNCPVAIALDNSGNVLISDFAGFGGSLWKVPAGGGSPTLLTSGFTVSSMQVDSAGNIWMADGGQFLAVMIGGVAPVTRVRGLSLDQEMNGLRLDAVGNMFVSTSFQHIAAEIPSGGAGAPTTLATAPGDYVHGVATDGAGTTWLGDANAGNIIKASGGTQTILASGFDLLYGLAVFPPVAATSRASSTTVLSTTSATTVNTVTPVHLKAVVSTGGSTAGLVQFDSNSIYLGNAVATSGGVATLTTTLPAGTDSVTATFLGNSTTLASEGAPLTFTVNQLGTHTTLTTTSPSTIHGDTPVSLKAVVTGSHSVIPTGSVEFKIGTRVMASGTLDSTGTATASFLLPPGTSKVVAVYTGDSIFKGSSSSGLTFTTTPPYLSTISTNVTYGPPNINGAVRATIHIIVHGVSNNGAPTGTVSANDSFTCTALVPKAGTIISIASCSHLLPFNTFETVTVSYSGDATYDPTSTQVSVSNGGG